MATIGLRKKFGLSWLLLMSSFELFAEHSPNQIPFNAGIDQHGLGFGFSMNAAGGGYWFYDYNLHDLNKQIHFQLETSSRELENEAKTNLVRLDQGSLQGSYRHVYNSGWFIGLIGGWYHTTLKIEQTGLTEVQPKQKLNFSHRGWLVGPEVGWQGNDFYYFTVGVRNMAMLKVAEDYQSDKIYDVANHRSTADELWKNGKNYSALFFSFGWYLQSQPTRSSPTAMPDSVNDKELLEKAKKCQAKGGVWFNNMCRLDVD